MNLDPEKHRPLLEPILEQDELKVVLSDKSLLRPYLSSDAFFKRLRQEDTFVHTHTRLFFHTLLAQWLSTEEEKQLFNQYFLRELNNEADEIWDKRTIRKYLRDHDLIDEIVEAMERFQTVEGFKVPGENFESTYFSDLVEAASEAETASRRYVIYRHGAHLALFKAGVQADYIRKKHRTDQGLLKLRDYDQFGRSFFEQAATHRQAGEDKERVLEKIADGFTTIRKALHSLLCRFGLS